MSTTPEPLGDTDREALRRVRWESMSALESVVARMVAAAEQRGRADELREAELEIRDAAGVPINWPTPAICAVLRARADRITPTTEAEKACRRCGLTRRAAIAGVLCDPPHAGNHDFPTTEAGQR